MTTQTLAADLLDALLATWQVDATLATYGDRLRIFDGPPITDRAAEIELWVGATGLEPEETVIRSTQQWDTFAAAGDRGETLDITNAIYVADGSKDIKTARRLAITVFSAAAGAIRGTDLSVAGLFDAVEVTSHEVRQGQYPSGVGALLTFVVHAEGVL